MTTQQAIYELAKIVRTMIGHCDFRQRQMLDEIINSMSRQIGDPHFEERPAHWRARHEIIPQPAPPDFLSNIDDPLRGFRILDIPKPFTTEERLMIYEWALATMPEFVEVGQDYCLCNHINKLVPSEYSRLSILREYFPELHDQKPLGKGDSNLWWPTTVQGNMQRAKALRKAIKTCEAKIKEEQEIANTIRTVRF